MRLSDINKLSNSKRGFIIGFMKMRMAIYTKDKAMALFLL